MPPHIDPVAKFVEPMDDDDEDIITEMIPGRRLADAEVKQEPLRSCLVIVKEIHFFFL